MATKQTVVVVGTFLVASAQDKRDPRWKAPTVVELLPLNLSPGDWIGLRAFGKWNPGSGYPWSEGMAAAFLSGPTTTLSPWKGVDLPGAGVPAVNWPDGQPTRAENCFGVPTDRTLITRIPKGGTRLGVTAPDAFWADNSTAGYLLRITRPNLSGAGPLFEEFQSSLVDGKMLSSACCDCISGASELALDPLSDAEDAFLTASLPMQDWSASPIKEEGVAPMHPQWRGWYASKFAPAASGYSQTPIPPRRDKHLGWDIFCPFGTELVAPVAPCVVARVIPNHPTWGNTVLLRAKVGTKSVIFVYAHLNDVAVKSGDRISDTKATVGTSGCSGNGADPACGRDGPTDARFDHVHVEVLTPEKEPPDGSTKWNPSNPQSVLGSKWSLQVPK